MSQADIDKGLVQAYQDGNFSLTTAYENKKFTPPNSEYAAIYFIPNQPVVSSVGDDGLDLHTGIFQISLYYPLLKGKGPSITKADAICQYFKAGFSITFNGQVIRIRSSGYGRSDISNGWLQTIITVQWYAHVTR